MNDVKFNKLRSQGKPGAMNDKIKEATYWRTLGQSGLSVDDVKKKVFTALGYTGSMNDMEKKYWINL